MNACAAPRLTAIARRVISAALLAAGCGMREEARFTPVGSDVVPRLLHRASLLPDGRVLVSGGVSLRPLPPSLFTLRDVSVFDPAANAFSRLGGSRGTLRLRTPRSAHTHTTLVDGRVLIAGGYTGAAGAHLGNPTESVEVLDPIAVSTAAVPPMQVARAEHTATGLPDGRVVVAGGSSWQIFTPADTLWGSDRPLQRSRRAHAAVLIATYQGRAGDHRVLLIGGSGSGPDTLELLDPTAAATELSAARLDSGVDDLAAARLPDGRVFIVGGQLQTGDTINRTYFYDPDADRLTGGPDVPHRPGGLADHQLVVLGRYACVFGGEQQQGGQDTELDYAAVFGAESNAWVFAGRMAFTHDDFPAVALDQRRVLLIGGGAPFLGHAAPTANAEIFEIVRTFGLAP